MVNELAVEQAVLQVMSGRALSEKDCEKLDADTAVEVACRLREESRRLRDAE